jgi:hypothetical protein
MKITNKVTETSYIQWVEGFVKAVLDKAEIQCNEVTIEDIEFSKRIFLTIDGEEYNIRTWSFHPTGTDSNGETCAENVVYTLYKMVDDNDGSHGEDIAEGCIGIEWKNDSDKYSYKLLKISIIKNGKEEGKNVVKSADYEIIHEFNEFGFDDETETKLIAICKEKELSEDVYHIIKYKEDKPVCVSGVIFYNPSDKMYGSFLDGAEHDFRVMASVALGCDLE